MGGELSVNHQVAGSNPTQVKKNFVHKDDTFHRSHHKFMWPLMLNQQLFCDVYLILKYEFLFLKRKLAMFQIKTKQIAGDQIK